MEHIRPHFDRPPLVEQAIVAVFEPIEHFTIVDYGLFWAELKDEFPVVESTDPAVAQVESFDHPRAPDPTLQLLQSLPLPRAMFRDAVGGELVQLQADRFGFNWSKVDGGHYPRSEPVMARFENLFERFRSFVAGRGLGSMNLRQCELTNLNIIPVQDFGAGYDEMTEALRVDPLDLGLPFLRAETYTRSRQHRILGSNGDSLGRLHTVITPVVSTQDGAKAFRLEFTARSRPSINSLDEMRAFFAVGRDAINGAFCSTVTDKMRERWGQYHA